MGGPKYLRKTNRFLWEFPRLLRGLDVAAKLGTNVALLLRLVLEHENANFFERPAVLTTPLLMKQMGISSRTTFREARTKAVAAGWLDHAPQEDGTKAGDEYWTRLPGGLIEELERDISIGFRIDLEPGGNLSLDGKTIILLDAPPCQILTGSPPSTLSEIDMVVVKKRQGTLSEIDRVVVKKRQGPAAPTSTLLSPSPKELPHSPPASASDESTSSEKTADRPLGLAGLFARIWSAYPRKEARPRAEGVFAVVIASATEEPETLVARMLASIDRSIRSEAWRRGERWIPLLANWLADERWRDEVATVQSAAQRIAETEEKNRAIRESLRGPVATIAEVLAQRASIPQPQSETDSNT